MRLTIGDPPPLVTVAIGSALLGAPWALHLTIHRVEGAAASPPRPRAADRRPPCAEPVPGGQVNPKRRQQDMRPQRWPHRIAGFSILIVALILIGCAKRPVNAPVTAPAPLGSASRAIPATSSGDGPRPAATAPTA